VSLRLPRRLARVAGTSGEGTAHWWAERASALALVPLTLWFLVALVRLPLADYAAVTIWLGGGWHPVWLALLLLALCRHANLGLQVIIEDYVHAPALKLVAMLVNNGAHLLLLAGGLYAVGRIALRGAA
jgi:succinate dehydrogenase / fumarate reductase membrane anchor subunit